MAYSRVTIPSDGSTMLMTVEFALGYISQDEVKCQANDEVDGAGNPVYRSLTFISESQIQVGGTPIPAGKNYVFIRTVPKDALLVDWENGDPINEDNLNTSQKQAIMIGQEALDASERSVKVPVGFTPYEIEAGLVSGDFVGMLPSGNLGKLANGLDIAGAGASAAAAAASATAAASSAGSASASAGSAATDAAAAHADRLAADTSASNASGSATAAAGSASSASGSATAASGSATAAGGSATAANASKIAAGTSETNAATSATNANNSAVAAAASAASIGNVVGRVATISALKLLTNTVTSQHLEQVPQQGLFTWIAGNFTAQVAADPLGGIFIPSTVSGQGVTIGCWVRDQPPGASLNPQWFGAPLDGSTDDQPALQAALNFASFLGGCTVELPTGRTGIIKSPLNIKKRCTLKGSTFNTGSPGDNTTTLYGAYQALKVDNSPGTGIINMESGSALIGITVYKNGMVWPATANSMTANSALWTGTAVQVQGEDTLIQHCTFLGFNTVLFSTGFQRIRIYDTNVDCVNGFNIQNCLDITYISRVHCWPFATIAASAAAVTGASILRAGIAFDFEAGGDWNKVSDCFSYGYKVGFKILNCNSMTLLNCSSDNAPSIAGTVGFQILGTSLDTRLIGCQSAASEQGIYCGASADGTVITDFNCWANTTHGILVDGAGNVSIHDSYIRNVPNGITVNNTTAKVDIDGVRWNTVTAPIVHAVTTTNVTLSSPKYGSGAPPAQLSSSAARVPSIASAATITLPMEGDVFVITGTTSITTINGRWPGRRVSLIITGVMNVGANAASATGSIVPLKAIASVANGPVTITMVTDGDRWFVM